MSEQTNEVEIQTINVNTIDDMMSVLYHWHAEKVAVLKHMINVPDEAKVTIDEKRELILKGEVREAFKLGLTLALIEMGKLPFVVELQGEPMSEGTTVVEASDDALINQAH